MSDCSLTWALKQLVTRLVRLRNTSTIADEKDTVLLRALVLLIGELVKK
jgi:hypothetical protein